MGHYKSNLRDIEFTLFEVLGRQKVLGTGPYAEIDEDTARSILDEVERLATGPLAESLLDVRPQPAGLRPRHPLGDDARRRSGRATRPTWTPSGGGWTCPRSSAAPWSRRRCAGRSPS